MANRYPLVYNPSANQIQEISNGDTLNIGITSVAAFATPKTVTNSIVLDDINLNYAMIGPISVAVGATIAVGVGCSYVVI